MFEYAAIDRYVVRTRAIGVRHTRAVAVVVLRVSGMAFGFAGAVTLDLRESPVMEDVVDEGQAVDREKEIE